MHFVFKNRFYRGKTTKAMKKSEASVPGQTDLRPLMAFLQLMQRFLRVILKTGTIVAFIQRCKEK